MSKRPIRVTISMTPDEYDVLGWLGFQWAVNPSTLAHEMCTMEMNRRMTDSQELQRQYQVYRKSKLQAVPGRERKKGAADGQG